MRRRGGDEQCKLGRRALTHRSTMMMMLGSRQRMDESARFQRCSAGVCVGGAEEGWGVGEAEVATGGKCDRDRPAGCAVAMAVAATAGLAGVESFKVFSQQRRLPMSVE